MRTTGFNLLEKFRNNRFCDRKNLLDDEKVDLFANSRYLIYKLSSINHTILALSPKQAKRCYDYFYCGISMPSIAEKEGTTVGSVSGSIKSALINLREKCNLFIKP